MGSKQHPRCLGRLAILAALGGGLASCGSDVTFADGHVHGAAVTAAGPLAGARIRVYQADKATGEPTGDPLDETVTTAEGTWDLDVGDAPAIAWSPGTPAAGVVLDGQLTATLTAIDAQGIAAFDIVEPAGAGDGDGTLPTIVYQETPPAGAEYDRTLSVRALDTLGHEASDARTWRMDTWPPRISVAGVIDGAYYATARSLTWTVTDANLASVVATLDGLEAVSGTEVATEGAHTLSVSATDDASHYVEVTRGFTLDLHASVIVWNAVTPPEGAVRHADFLLDATASDAHLAPHPAGLRIVDGPPTLIGQDSDGAAGHLLATFPAASLADGSYTVVLRAEDLAGTPSQLPRGFVVDHTPPTIAVSTAPPLVDGDFSSAASVTVTVTVTDANRDAAAESVTVTGCPAPSASVTGDTASYVTTCVTEGEHLVSASATDRAGLGASRSSVLRLDRGAPDITITSGPSAGASVRGAFGLVAVLDDDAKALGSLTPADASRFWVESVTGACAAAATAGAVEAPGDGTLCLTVSFSIGEGHDGPCSVALGGRDKVGNLAPAIVRSFVVDNSPPIVTVTSPVWGTTAQRTISGTTDEPVTAVTVTVTGIGEAIATLDTSTSWHHVTPALANDTAYVVSVSATDPAGNLGTASGTVGYDATAPQLVVVPNTDVRDESAAVADGGARSRSARTPLPT